MIEAVGYFRLGQVTAVGEHDAGCARDAGLDGAGVRVDIGDVTLADDDQRRNAEIPETRQKGLTLNEKTLACSGVRDNPAERVIRRFGGQSALAQLLGKRQSTVQHWARTGRVPAQWHHALLALARQRGIILEARVFVETSKHYIEPGAGRLGVLTVGLDR